MKAGSILGALEDLARSPPPAEEGGKESSVFEWPAPVDFLADDRATGAPVLRAEHLPPALAPFVFDTAARMGVDPASVALAALVTASAVMPDTWEIQPKQHDGEWREQPRLWGAIVGDPSIRKTPVISAATKPIERLEREAQDEYAAALRAHRAAEDAWKKAGSDPAEAPTAPKRRRYMVAGCTTEALQEILRDDPDAKQHAPARKVLVRQDEMSEWVGNLDRYRAGGKGGGDRGAYLRLFNGGLEPIDRVGRGSFVIPNWSASFIGGIQPEPIQRIARDAADDGLLQRFLYVVATHQLDGEDRAPDRAALDRYAALFPALANLHPPAAMAGAPRPRVVLDAGAHQHRIALDRLLTQITRMPDTSRRIMGALGKWHGLFARLALVFHLIDLADANARGEPAPVLTVLPEATAARAAAFLREVALPHLLRADALMFATAQTGHAAWIAGFLLATPRDRVTDRDIARAYGALRAPEERRTRLEVMEGLVSFGWLEPEEPPPGRPTSSWLVNPAIYSLFAARALEEARRRTALRAEIYAAAQARRSQA